MLKNEKLKNSELITSYSSNPLKFDENGLLLNNDLSKEAIDAFLTISGFELVEEQKKSPSQEQKSSEVDSEKKTKTLKKN